MGVVIKVDKDWRGVGRPSSCNASQLPHFLVVIIIIISIAIVVVVVVVVVVTLAEAVHINSFRETVQDVTKDCRCEVTQWSTGAQITDGDHLMATIRLESKPVHHLTIVCCGPTEQRRRLFFYQVLHCMAIALHYFICQECAARTAPPPMAD